MLRELHIVNLAVIAEARVELVGGLNCFTGATGAGKSLVIGAVNVLLGLRGAGEMLRRGCDEGRVTGVFEVSDPVVLDDVRAIVDLPLDDEEGARGELLITRRLFASGQTRVSLNGNPITLGQLRQIGERLVDVHGQHDGQFLLKPANQLDTLDQFAGLGELRGEYSQVWQELQSAKSRLEELSRDRERRMQTLELFRFQADEIDAAALDPEEFDKLQSRAAVLENLEQLQTESAELHSGLYDADGSVVDRLKSMTRQLEDLADLDAELKPIVDAVRGGTLQLEEAARDLGRYVDKLDLDPAELAEINERLTGIHKVLHKYGGTMEAALAYRADIGSQIKDLSQQSEDFGDLASKIGPLQTKLLERGKALRQRRLAAARKLGPVVEEQLAELGMEKARFRIDVTSLGETADAATPAGLDVVEFVAQTNPGLAAQPLRKIASGGELSRIMLALKRVLAKSDRVSVLVFDEIDANVGGRLGAVIGGKLRQLAADHQVLCITHLPQIACYADCHLTVRKQQAGDETKTVVRVVEGEERLEEVAEMIGGTRITDITRAQARELLDAAGELGASSNGSGKSRVAPQRSRAKRLEEDAVATSNRAQ